MPALGLATLTLELISKPVSRKRDLRVGDNFKVMQTQEVILQLLMGGLLGAVGQGLRIIVGMKKLNEDAKELGTKVGALLDTSRMVVSLLIGFCTGILTVVSMSDFDKVFFSGADLKQHLLSIIAAGYAGTDFIEGLMKKYLPNTNAAVQKPDTGTPKADKPSGS